MYTILMLVIAYVIGSVPSGLIIGKVFYKTDIREHGSGNLGATNTFRVLGVKAGIIVMIADILKGTLAASLPYQFQHLQIPIEWNINPLLVGLFAVIGHMYPVFAGFRGGKAVATSSGVVLFYEPLLFLLLVITFIITLSLFRYVSLSSMVSSIVACIYALFTRDLLLIVIIFLLTIFIFYRHRDNIKRIKNKTEPKVKWFKK